MAKILIDTNILLYAMDCQSKFYQSACNLFKKIESGEFEAFISERSLYELVAVLSSPVFSDKASNNQLKEYLQYLTSELFTILYTNPQITATS